MSTQNPMHDITRLAAAVRKAMLQLPPLPSPPKAYPKNQEKKS